jgi:hypothetical protein
MNQDAGPSPLGPDEVRLVAHLAVVTGLGLAELGRDLAESAGLPDFAFELTGGSARGWSRAEGLEVELDGPFPEGLLRCWDRAFPAESNVLVLLKVPRSAPEPGPDVVPGFGRLLADLTGSAVVHAGTTRHVFEP